MKRGLMIGVVAVIAIVLIAGVAYSSVTGNVIFKWIPKWIPRAVAPTCTDSDAGENALVKGTTSYSGNTKTDYCADANSVMEFSCKGWGGVRILVYGRKIACQSGYSCKEGICLSSAPAEVFTTNSGATQIDTPVEPSPIKCTDSDGGINYGVRGNIKVENIPLVGSIEISDYCSSQQRNAVNEFWCDPTKSQGYTKNALLCKYGCENGECVNTSVYILNSSMPAAFFGIVGFGNVSHYGLNAKTEIETIVRYDLDKTLIIGGVDFAINKGENISFGGLFIKVLAFDSLAKRVMLNITQNIIEPCEDSDNQYDYYKKGTARVKFIDTSGNPKIIENTDYCVDTSALSEAYCEFDRYVMNIVPMMPKYIIRSCVCQNGMCVR